MDRQEIENDRAKQRAKNLAEAIRQRDALHDQIVHTLRSRLPSVYDVRKVTRTSEQGTVYHSVSVTEIASQVSWSIRLGVRSSGRYSWSTGFEVECVGAPYMRERRNYEPNYRVTKSGWNFERMAADAERAIKEGISSRQRAAQRAESNAASAETFREVLGHVGGKAAYPGAHYANLSTPLFSVEMSAGDIHGGAVRLKVSLNKTCLNGQEAVRIIELLQGLQ